MENKDNLNNTSSYGEIKSRTERRKKLEQQEKINLKKEKELETKRQELKTIIFDDDDQKKKKTPSNDKTAKRKVSPKKDNDKFPKQKTIKTNLLLSLTMVIALGFTSYLIFDAFNQVEWLYQIINAILILLIVLTFIIAFKKTYTNHKTATTCITALGIIIMFIFNILVMTNVIDLPKQSAAPDFSKTSLTEAITWAEGNSIKCNQTYEYSDTIKKYSIISQDKKEGTLTKNIDKINFNVSNGPDYTKEVIIGSMVEWDIDEVVKVIDENILNNVTVKFEDNKDIKRDTVTEQNKTGNMKRNDAITFIVSYGNKASLPSIRIKNMKDMTLFKATLYLNRNAIDYELKYEFSDSIEKGHVINSSVKKDSKVAPGDKITLTISKGKKIIVPELKNMKMSEITKWIIQNNLKMLYSDKYDSEIKSGKIISSTYKNGDIIEEDTTVGIVVSKGKLKMPRFDNVASFKTWADKYEIKYKIKEDFNNDIQKGNIIKFSVETNGSINPDEGVVVYVSKGKAIDVPNFVGKTKSEIQNSCNNLNLSCSFVNEYSTKVKEGKAISQSIRAGEKVAQGDNIKISIATKNKTNSGNKGNSGNSGNSNSGSSGSGNTCDRSKTITITKQSSLNSNNVNTTLQNYKNAYPGIKFISKTKPYHTGSTGLVHPSTPKTFTANYCDTYTIYIIKND